jgi:hypothetical protein
MKNTSAIYKTMLNKISICNIRQKPTNGPALLWYRCKHWHLNGILHREDGPAVEYRDSGHKVWFLNGIYIFDNCSVLYHKLLLINNYYYICNQNDIYLQYI